MDIATMNTTKGALIRYYNVAHEAVLWKFDGLSEYDLRRPMTPTGTNLLGLVKHLAMVEAGYFGVTFARPDVVSFPEGQGTNADMYATVDESSADIIASFREVWTTAQATIDELNLDSEGHVPWWGEAGNPVTLARIMVHVTTEIYRHLGHMDIARETIDGATGMRDGAENMPELGDQDWLAYREKLESIAVEAQNRGNDQR